MATIDSTKDQLNNTQKAGYSTAWDWKGDYVSALQDDGLERFSQYSATPDTTLLFAGPARFTGLGGDAQSAGGALLPIGLVDGINFNSAPSLQRLFEIGSNRSFFTRGKSQGSIQFSKMLADQDNLLRVLTRNAYRPDMNVDGVKAPGPDGSNIMMNLDSEYFAVPFGLLLVMKTRGGNGGSGKVLAATYLEYCMLSGYSFQIGSQQPVIAEGVGIEFDRTIPVTMT